MKTTCMTGAGVPGETTHSSGLRWTAGGSPSSQGSSRKAGARCGREYNNNYKNTPTDMLRCVGGLGYTCVEFSVLKLHAHRIYLCNETKLLSTASRIAPAWPLALLKLLFCFVTTLWDISASRRNQDNYKMSNRSQMLPILFTQTTT